MYIFGALTERPLEMRFEGGHHHSYEKGGFLKSRRLAKVNIQMQKTTIRGRNTASHYIISVTISFPKTIIDLIWSHVWVRSCIKKVVLHNKTKSKYDLVDGEKYPMWSCKSKIFTTEVMFCRFILALVLQPQDNS